MPCNDVRERLSADLDGELSPIEARAVAEHLSSCAACQGERDRLIGVRAAVREQLPVLKAPDVLRARVTKSIRVASAGHTAGRRIGWPRQVAAGLLIAVASSAATLLLVNRTNAPATVATTDVVATHIRSLMANHLTDVTSTDEHNVKPWFDGKVPFAPEVPRLDSLGFPLIGGRVDSVGHDVAAALVYGRRKHVINVLVWLARDGSGGSDSPTSVIERGYNTVRWKHNDLQYAAVSDLAMDELKAFVAAFQAVRK